MENPTLVVLTDRNDLDGQLFDTFVRCHELRLEAALGVSCVRSGVAESTEQQSTRESLSFCTICENAGRAGVWDAPERSARL